MHKAKSKYEDRRVLPAGHNHGECVECTRIAVVRHMIRHRKPLSFIYRETWREFHRVPKGEQ